MDGACIAAGAVLGVTLLVSYAATGDTLCLRAVPARLWRLRAASEYGTAKMISRAWAPVAGFAGGATVRCSESARHPMRFILHAALKAKTALRATLSNMVLLSTTIRALVFAVGGLMLADRLLMFAILVPFALVGLWIGNRLHARVSREQLARVISGIVLLIGVSVLVRAFSS